MKLWIYCLVGLLAACSTVGEGHVRIIRVGGIERSIRWQTSAATVPDFKFQQGEPVWPLSLEIMPVPRGYFFVPVCCSGLPWFEDIPMVGDDGKPAGTMHADGFTRVLKPFSSGPRSSRFWIGDAPQSIVGGFGDEYSDPTQPWKLFSIYLFAFPDTVGGREAARSVKNLDDIFRGCDFIVEVYTDESEKASKSAIEQGP